MKRTKLILASVALALPVAFAIHLRVAKSSEPPGRFVVNGDGTATDTVTQLTWQQATVSNGDTLPAAEAYCAGATIGSTFSTGWRLPTIKELLSIVDFESATSPMIDAAIFSGTSVDGFGYWTSTTPLGQANTANYCVAFNNGVVTSTGCGGSCQQIFRCVHSPAGADAGP